MYRLVTWTSQHLHHSSKSWLSIRKTRLLPKHELSAKLNGPLRVMENEAALEIPSHNSTFNNLAWIIRNFEQSVVVARWHWTQTIHSRTALFQLKRKVFRLPIRHVKDSRSLHFLFCPHRATSRDELFNEASCVWPTMSALAHRSGFLTHDRRWVMRILRIKGALM